MKKKQKIKLLQSQRTIRPPHPMQQRGPVALSGFPLLEKKRPRQESQPHEMRVIKKIKGMHPDVVSMRS